MSTRAPELPATKQPQLAALICMQFPFVTKHTEVYMNKKLDFGLIWLQHISPTVVQFNFKGGVSFFQRFQTVYVFYIHYLSYTGR